MINSINSTKSVKLKIIAPGFNLYNNEKIVNGNITLNEIEKKANFGEFILDRGMSIRNLNKTLSELSNGNDQISFNLISKSEKLIKDLEESEINFKNYKSLSCYQSATLQGFIHVIFPLAIKNLNKEREKNGQEKLKSLDELKNFDIFNDTVIDTIKEILFIQGCGNGGINKDGEKRYQASKLFEVAPPILLGGGIGVQDSDNIRDVSKNHEDIIHKSKEKEIQDHVDKFWKNISNPPKKRFNSIESTFLTGEIKPIEIYKKTIVSEIIKFKVEGNNKYYGSLVLKFNENDLKDDNLDICKLIRNCPQIKINNYLSRKIIETSDMIFMITDRIEFEETIRKQFKVYEKIYLDNSKGYFYYSNYPNFQSTLFELKFVIFHYFYTENFGHYIAYCKIKGKWYLFNDLTDDYAKCENPPLINNTKPDFYPVAFYYVKNKNNFNLFY